MATPQTVNFFSPGTEAGLDFSQVQRQRALAELLTRQGMAPQQGTMAGNIYVPPSALSYVNQLASALGGGFMQHQADASERDILAQAQARRTAEADAFMKAANGIPAGAGDPQQAAGPWDADNGPPMQPSAAVAPDRAKAIAIALQSSNPALQAMGGKLMEQQMTEQQLKDIMSQYGPGAVGGAASGSPGGASGAGGGGVPPGVNPLAFALTGSGNPTFGKLGTMIQEASKPQNVAEGGTVWDPARGVLFTAPKTEAGITVRNGQAAPLPGFQEAQARREGMVASAVDAAKAQGDMVTLEVNGRPVTKTRAQWAAEMGGTRTAPLPGYQSEPAMRATAGTRDDAAAAPVIREAATSEIAALKRDLANTADPKSKAMILQEIDRLGGQLTSLNAATPPAAAGGVQGQSSGEKAYGDARAKDFAEQASGYQKAGQQGSSTLRDLDQLRTLYADPNVAKGALAENISGLKNLGASFGVDMKGLSSEQAAEAITNKMALGLRSTADGGGMPGAMSDADRNFLKALTPNLTKSPEGRQKIMDAQQKVAQRQIDVARLANEYERRNGRLDAGFDQVLQDYAAKNRMFTQAQPGGGFKIIGVR